jgi:hypothetical protein
VKKKKPDIRIDTYGRYSAWDTSTKELPEILEFTETIEAAEGNEFGMVLRIRGGKGLKLAFCIKHPPFIGKRGKPEPDFTGEYYVNSNDFRFFIGDGIRPPAEDKAGKWEIFVYFEGEIIASRSFQVILPK